MRQIITVSKYVGKAAVPGKEKATVHMITGGRNIYSGIYARCPKCTIYVIFNHTDKQRKNLSCIYKMQCLYLQMDRMRKKADSNCRSYLVS